jgi:hypothetical protein
MNVSTDPTALITHIWHLRSMLESGMEQVVEQFVRRQPDETDWHPDRAALFGFRLPRRRCLQVVCWAPSNYVAVFSRIVPFGPPRLLDQAGWKFWCYHDSCWRTDGLERVMREYLDKVEGWDFGRMWTIEPVSAEVQEAWRATIRQAREPKRKEAP